MKSCALCKIVKIYYAVLIDYVMEKIKTFDVLEWALVKVCLVSIGLIFGSFYNKFIRKNIVLITIIAICSYVYLMYKLFFEKNNEV